MIFVQPPSTNGGHTAVIRITAVQPESFTCYVQEAPNQDGAHSAETVSYLVLEAGHWELPDGTQVEVGQVWTDATVGRGLTGDTWEAVALSAPFTDPPLIITQVQTEQDSGWVKTRQRNGTATGFEVALEPADSQTQAHAPESIGWVAFAPGSGTWNGHPYLAARTSNGVTHAWFTVSFGSAFSQPPRFIAGLETYDGGDGSAVRYQQRSAAGIQVKVEEDTTTDTEVRHTTEVVAYLALQGSGTLTGRQRTQYYYHGGQRVALRKDGAIHYLHTDHLGSTLLTTDAAGDVVARRRYHPYSEERYVAGDVQTDFGYTGQRDVVGTGLMYYHARYYHPALGRFVSADTIVPEAGNPQSLNRYAYTLNNPLRYVDPSGNFDEEIVEKYGNGNAMWDSILRQGELGDLVLYGYEGEDPLYAMFVLSSDAELEFWLLTEYGGRETSIESVRNKFDSEKAAMYRPSQFPKEGGPTVGVWSAEGWSSLVSTPGYKYNQFQLLLGGASHSSDISVPSTWHIGGTSHVYAFKQITGLNISFETVGALLSAAALATEKPLVAAIEALPAGWVAPLTAKYGGKAAGMAVPFLRMVVALHTFDQLFKSDTVFMVTPGMGPLPPQECPTPQSNP